MSAAGPVQTTQSQPFSVAYSSVDGDVAPATQANGKTEQQRPNGEPQNKSKQHPGQDIQRAGTEIKDKITDKKQKIKDKTAPPGGFDATPLPDAPPGFTVKFTFHKAWNLPAADLHTHSADPFVHATLLADVPRRHKEDPDLTFRTRTLQKTTEPQWEQEWIVANVPATGFTLECRLYDEDNMDHDDRLGKVTIRVPHVGLDWKGFGPEGQTFEVKKRSGSKRAYLLKAALSALSKNVSMTPSLCIGIDVLGPSDPPHAQMYTVGPTSWVRHFSPMIGRLAGVKVNRDEGHDVDGAREAVSNKQTKKYDFQANEIQLAGPVPPKLYHRYVEFRPLIGMMFSSHGLRGRILNKALHKQHKRVYNYDTTTQYGSFKPESTEASLQFLKMVHFDEGGRIFTYVLTLDGILRFTETGQEFGIDLLSKHTMHSDVATYIACSGEFFIRRPAKQDKARGRPRSRGSAGARSTDATHEQPPHNPGDYQLVIDNDSGTYRPDKSVLPDLAAFLSRNLPGIDVRAMHCADEELTHLKEEQLRIKKREGPGINMVFSRSRSSSGSMSSSDESRLAELESHGAAGPGAVAGRTPPKSKKEKAWDVVEDPRRLKDWRGLVGVEGDGSRNVEQHPATAQQDSSRADGEEEQNGPAGAKAGEGSV